jgi:hypothetical protein
VPTLTEEDRLNNPVLRPADVGEIETKDENDAGNRGNETDHSEGNENAGATVPDPQCGERRRRDSPRDRAENFTTDKPTRVLESGAERPVEVSWTPCDPENHYGACCRKH